MACRDFASIMKIAGLQLLGTSPENIVPLYNHNKSCRTWLDENWTSSAIRPASSSQRLAFIQRKACHRSSIDHRVRSAAGMALAHRHPPANNVSNIGANSSSCGRCTKDDPENFCSDFFQIFAMRHLGNDAAVRLHIMKC